MTEPLTDKQQQALAHLEGSRREGLTLSAYARVHDLPVREIYDALAALRRKGVLPRPGSPSPFVAVRVTSTVATAPLGRTPLCRVLVGSTVAIECSEWPPAAWLMTLLAGRADAAS